MNPRPRSITAISWLFIAMGSVALVVNLLPLANPTPGQRLADLAAARLAELWPLYVSQTAALLAGVLMLRGSNWGRWLLVGWLVFHVGLSFLHGPAQMVTHSLLLVAGVYFLFRPPAAAYFRSAVPGPSATAPDHS